MLQRVPNHTPFLQIIFFLLPLFLLVKFVVIIIYLSPLIIFKITWDALNLLGISIFNCLNMGLLLAELINPDIGKVFILDKLRIGILRVEKIDGLPFQEITISRGDALLLCIAIAEIIGQDQQNIRL